MLVPSRDGIYVPDIFYSGRSVHTFLCCTRTGHQLTRQRVKKSLTVPTSVCRTSRELSTKVMFSFPCKVRMELQHGVGVNLNTIKEISSNKYYTVCFKMYKQFKNKKGTKE